MCIPLPIDSPSPPVPAVPQKYAQNGAAAELCRDRDLCHFPAVVEIYVFFLPRQRTFNIGSCYEPVLKGGPEPCGSPTCATL